MRPWNSTNQPSGSHPRGSSQRPGHGLAEDAQPNERAATAYAARGRPSAPPAVIHRPERPHTHQQAPFELSIRRSVPAKRSADDAYGDRDDSRRPRWSGQPSQAGPSDAGRGRGGPGYRGAHGQPTWSNYGQSVPRERDGTSQHRSQQQQHGQQQGWPGREGHGPSNRLWNSSVNAVTGSDAAFRAPTVAPPNAQPAAQPGRRPVAGPASGLLSSSTSRLAVPAADDVTWHDQTSLTRPWPDNLLAHHFSGHDVADLYIARGNMIHGFLSSGLARVLKGRPYEIVAIEERPSGLFIKFAAQPAPKAEMIKFWAGEVIKHRAPIVRFKGTSSRDAFTQIYWGCGPPPGQGPVAGGSRPIYTAKYRIVPLEEAGQRPSTVPDFIEALRRAMVAGDCQEPHITHSPSDNVAVVTYPGFKITPKYASIYISYNAAGTAPPVATTTSSAASTSQAPQKRPRSPTPVLPANAAPASKAAQPSSSRLPTPPASTLPQQAVEPVKEVEVKMEHYTEDELLKMELDDEEDAEDARSVSEALLSAKKDKGKGRAVSTATPQPLAEQVGYPSPAGASRTSTSEAGDETMSMNDGRDERGGGRDNARSTHGQEKDRDWQTREHTMPYPKVVRDPANRPSSNAPLETNATARRSLLQSSVSRHGSSTDVAQIGLLAAKFSSKSATWTLAATHGRLSAVPASAVIAAMPSSLVVPNGYARFSSLKLMLVSDIPTLTITLSVKLAAGTGPKAGGGNKWWEEHADLKGAVTDHVVPRCAAHGFVHADTIFGGGAEPPISLKFVCRPDTPSSHPPELSETHDLPADCHDSASGFQAKRARFMVSIFEKMDAEDKVVVNVSYEPTKVIVKYTTSDATAAPQVKTAAPPTASTSRAAKDVAPVPTISRGGKAAQPAATGVKVEEVDELVSSDVETPSAAAKASNKPAAPAAPAPRPPFVPAAFPSLWQGSTVDSRETKLHTEAFIQQYFPAFDSARSSITSYYSPSALFSLRVIPPGPGAAKFDREFLGVANRLAITPTPITNVIQKFPTGHHDLDSFVYDAYAFTPSNGAQPTLVVSLHGTFTEWRTKVSRSFDRVFVLVRQQGTTVPLDYVIQCDEVIFRQHSILQQPLPLFRANAKAPPKVPASPSRPSKGKAADTPTKAVLAKQPRLEVDARSVSSDSDSDVVEVSEHDASQNRRRERATTVFNDLQASTQEEMAQMRVELAALKADMAALKDARGTPTQQVGETLSKKRKGKTSASTDEVMVDHDPPPAPGSKVVAGQDKGKKRAGIEALPPEPTPPPVDHRSEGKRKTYKLGTANAYVHKYNGATNKLRKLYPLNSTEFTYLSAHGQFSYWNSLDPTTFETPRTKDDSNLNIQEGDLNASRGIFAIGLKGATAQVTTEHQVALIRRASEKKKGWEVLEQPKDPGPHAAGGVMALSMVDPSSSRVKFATGGPSRTKGHSMALWEVSNSRSIAKHSILAASLHTSTINSIVWMKGKDWIVTGSDDKKVRVTLYCASIVLDLTRQAEQMNLFDFTTSTVVKSFSVPDRVSNVMSIPNEPNLIVARIRPGKDEEQTVEVYDVRQSSFSSVFKVAFQPQKSMGRFFYGCPWGEHHLIYPDGGTGVHIWDRRKAARLQDITPLATNTITQVLPINGRLGVLDLNSIRLVSLS